MASDGGQDSDKLGVRWLAAHFTRIAFAYFSFSFFFFCVKTFGDDLNFLPLSAPVA